MITNVKSFAQHKIIFLDCPKYKEITLKNQDKYCDLKDGT